jgi:hypothetical protein
VLSLNIHERTDISLTTFLIAFSSLKNPFKLVAGSATPKGQPAFGGGRTHPQAKREWPSPRGWLGHPLVGHRNGAGWPSKIIFSSNFFSFFLIKVFFIIFLGPCCTKTLSITCDMWATSKGGTSVSILRWVTWRSVKKVDGELAEVPTGFFH